MTETPGDSTDTVLVLNPQSGSGTHGKKVRDRATLLGYDVQETQRENHAIDLATSAAQSGANRVVAAGGDGTLNEVVRGVIAAEALDTVTVGVIPVGTGNDFATNIGITDIDKAFQVLEDGERRRLDLGLANDSLFLNSCVAGITAEASDETSAELKSRFGVLAYVLTTLKMATEFSGVDVSAAVHDGSSQETVWEGSASIILVGNGRRFAQDGSTQANLEDGLFDVTIVEEAASLNLAQDHLAERLLDRSGESITRFLASSLDLHIEQDTPAMFSLDGEMVNFDAVKLQARKQAVSMVVGDGYDERPRIEGGNDANN